MAGDCYEIYVGPHSWNFESAPLKNANERKLELFRGRFLGGSSGLNSTLCIRGTKQDYDDWGLQGWSGEEVFAAMRKAETFHPKDWFHSVPEAHGTEGPIHIEPYEVAPISELFLKSYQSRGLPLHHDMFSTGDCSHGCGHVLRTHSKGLRSTGADYVTTDRVGENLELLKNTLVDKVNIKEDTNGWHATSVDMIHSDGTRGTAHARREIVLSGGSYCSPAVLIRSGIGRWEDLEKLNIECYVDSRGVGQNLQDHIICIVPYQVGEPGLTLDHLAWGGDARSKALSQYRKDRSGFLSAVPMGVVAYARLDDRLQDSSLWQEEAAKSSHGRDPMGLTPSQPNMETISFECALPGLGGDGEQSIIAHFVELFSARSTGTVILDSADPYAKPIIDHNFFEDALDLEVLSEACHFANEIVMKGDGTASVIKGSWPPDQKHHLFKSREEWKPWIKDHCQTCYHPSGTCKMGNDGDEMAVLDARLKVRGVHGLRVADCSVLPRVPQGHTQMIAYAVGEICADFIKKDAKLA